MKRSVAILGPTPMFVRWAIEYPCPLRELHPRRLPETTFRQLRGLREISIAISENRVFENVCIHPTARSQDASNALGFPIDEVAVLFGGTDTIERCCGTCDANAQTTENTELWSGCFGWLATDLRFNLKAATLGSSQVEDQFVLPTELPPGRDLVELVEQSVQDQGLGNELAVHFPKTNPRWFGLWQHAILKPSQLTILESVFHGVKAKFEIKYNEESCDRTNSPPDLTCFLDAILRSRRHSLPLHVELIPAGFSDGRQWTIRRHCSICKCPATSDMTACPACGQAGHQQNEIKLKVLGIRPYLRLAAIFGIDATERFLLRFEASRS